MIISNLPRDSIKIGAVKSPLINSNLPSIARLFRISLGLELIIPVTDKSPLNFFLNSEKNAKKFKPINPEAPVNKTLLFLKVVTSNFSKRIWASVSISLNALFFIY